MFGGQIFGLILFRNLIVEYIGFFCIIIVFGKNNFFILKRYRMVFKFFYLVLVVISQFYVYFVLFVCFNFYGFLKFNVIQFGFGNRFYLKFIIYYCFVVIIFEIN